MESNNTKKESPVFEYIRTAKRTQICAGDIYAECPNCQQKIRMLPGYRCACGNIIFSANEEQKLQCEGGKGMIRLYRLSRPSNAETDMLIKEITEQRKAHEKHIIENRTSHTFAKKPGKKAQQSTAMPTFHWK